MVLDSTFAEILSIKILKLQSSAQNLGKGNKNKSASEGRSTASNDGISEKTMRSARETPKSKREAGNDVDERGSRYHTFTMDNREYKRFFSNDEITYIPEKHVERGDQVFRHSKATICEENDEVKGVGGIIARGHSLAIVDKEQKYLPGTKATEQHWKKEQGEQGVKGDGSNGLFNNCRQVSETEEKNSSRGGRYEHTHSFSWNQATELGSKKRTSQYFEIDSQCNHPESLRYFSCDERNYSEGGVELKRHASEIDYDDDRNSGGSNSGRISDSSALGKDDGGNKIDHMQSGRETKGVNFLGMRLKNIDNNQAAEAREIIVHETKDMTLYYKWISPDVVEYVLKYRTTFIRGGVQDAIAAGVLSLMIIKVMSGSYYYMMFLMILVAICFIVYIMTKVKQEKLVVIRNVGVQIETHHLYTGLKSVKYVGRENICDVVIHEALTWFQYKYFLAIFVRNSKDSIVVFPHLLPKLDFLRFVYLGIKKNL